jgi:hypothetical protein
MYLQETLSVYSIHSEAGKKTLQVHRLCFYKNIARYIRLRDAIECKVTVGCRICGYNGDVKLE